MTQDANSPEKPGKARFRDVRRFLLRSLESYAALAEASHLVPPLPYL